MADPTNDEFLPLHPDRRAPRPGLDARTRRDRPDQGRDLLQPKHFGIGAGLIAAAAFVGVFLLGTLIATGILALSLVMPGWAAALTVSGVLLLIIAIMVGIAILNFKRGAAPLESIDSLRKDLDVVKGTGDYDRD